METRASGVSHRESLNRIRRISGQIEGIRRMIEGEEYCVKIMIQIQAVRSALRGVELQILQKHMHDCVRVAFESGGSPATEEKIAELLRLMKKDY